MVWFCRLNIIDPSTHFHVMVFIQESELINPSDFFLNLSWHNCIETSNFNARLIDQAQDYAEERRQCSHIASTITTTKDRVFPWNSAETIKTRGKQETIHLPTNATNKHRKYSDQGYSIPETSL